MFTPNRPFSGVKQLTPRNHGVKKRAQQRLDHVISRANAQYDNALSVDGIEFIHWSCNTGYNVCTCADRQTHLDHTEIPFDGNENLSEEPLARNVGRNTIKVSSKATGLKAEYGGSSLVSTGEAAIRAFADFTNNALDDGDITESEIESIINNADSFQGMIGNNMSCPICLGTGYTDSYTMTNGKRYVLDASGFYTFKMHGGLTLDLEELPHEFTGEMTPNNYVTWEIRIPTYFSDVLAPKVLHVRDVNTDSFLFVREKGTTKWLPFDLTEYKGKTVEVMACPSRSTNGRQWRITHVEFHLKMGDWLIGQFPQIQQQSSVIASNFQETTIVLSPRLAQLNMKDVVLDSKYNNLWLVKDYTTSETTDRMSLGWQGNVRIIQDREALSILKIIKNPSFNVPHSGFAQLQKAQDRYFTPLKGLKK